MTSIFELAAVEDAMPSAEERNLALAQDLGTTTSTTSAAIALVQETGGKEEVKEVQKKVDDVPSTTPTAATMRPASRSSSAGGRDHNGAGGGANSGKQSRKYEEIDFNDDSNGLKFSQSKVLEQTAKMIAQVAARRERALIRKTAITGKRNRNEFAVCLNGNSLTLWNWMPLCTEEYIRDTIVVPLKGNVTRVRETRFEMEFEDPTNARWAHRFVSSYAQAFQDTLRSSAVTGAIPAHALLPPKKRILSDYV